MDVGPIDDQVMVALVRDGVITGATLVWRDDWKTWQPASQTELAAMIQRTYHTPYQGMPVLDVAQRQPPPSPPSQRPLSKAWALLGLLLPGLPQILFGQVEKGVVIIFLAMVFGATFWPYILAYPFWLLMVVDAHCVGQALERGDPVGKMTFFPK